MTKKPNDEEFGPFGENAISILELLFPNVYKMVLVINPTFCEVSQANICPQFDYEEFFILSSGENFKNIGSFFSELKKFQVSEDLEEQLDTYRYQNAILATKDLGVLTLWAQAEYAVIAFRMDLAEKHEIWLNSMLTLDVTRTLD